MAMNHVRPTPAETRDNLDWLVKQRLLSDPHFKELHHLGDSIRGFKRYCSKIETFLEGSENHRLAGKLKAMRDLNDRSR